jgi:hypothetical protein
MRLQFHFIRKAGLWWITKRKWFIRLFWLNVLIWFWPCYLGSITYKEVMAPNEISFAQMVKTVIENPTLEPLPQTIEDTIDFYASRFGVDAGLIKKIAMCESGMNPDRIGQEKVALNSVGLMQFQPQTFYANAAKYKIKNANLYDYRDQILVAVQMIRDEQASAWSCYKLIK